MEVKAVMPPRKFHQWLPYWAVFQTDLRQTPANWAWRLWVVLSVAAGGGYLMYRSGLHREAGLLQSAAAFVGDLLRSAVVATLTLVLAFTAGCIASESGTLGDSVLCRGISRRQYFLAKWHARLVSVLGTYLVLATVLLVSCHFLLHDELSFTGSVAGVCAVGAVLAAVVSCGVTVSALSGGTVLALTVLWVGLYALGFLLTLLPAPMISPDRLVQKLPQVLRGTFDSTELTRLILNSLAVSVAAGVIGMAGFTRRDI